MDKGCEIKKEAKNIKWIILISIALIIIVSIGVAFARYITRINGTTQAPIARWNFRVTAGSSENLQIDLADTRYLNDTTEVDRTKVAPGTKGAIQLNVDGSGSQVSLQYNIDMTLTQIPENLIFYEDEEMTTALLKENGKIHLDGYFGASDTNKTATKNLYWQWKLETGSTQTEIDANDLLDSNWIGERITLGIVATGRQVVDNPATQYAVTFDLNGGKLEDHGDSEQITKQVSYGEAYGDLPVPTREGYRFVGWNGKNLFDENNFINTFYSYYLSTCKPEKTQFQGEDVLKVYGGITLGGRNVEYMKGIFKDNTQYTFSMDLYDVPAVDASDNNTYTGLSIFCVYTDGSNESILGNNRIDNSNKWNKIIFISKGNKTISHFAVSFGTPYAYSYMKNIQLEEGSIATMYEPYTITSLTTVSQNKNHTLTAIWEPISNP